MLTFVFMTTQAKNHDDDEPSYCECVPILPSKKNKIKMLWQRNSVPQTSGVDEDGFFYYFLKYFFFILLMIFFFNSTCWVVFFFLNIVVLKTERWLISLKAVWSPFWIYIFSIVCLRDVRCGITIILMIPHSLKHFTIECFIRT